MKKVFGVMILAGLPVACGTTLPSTPEVPQAAHDAAQVVAASGASRFIPPPEQAKCEPSDPTGAVRSIEISVLDRGKGWVRLGTNVVLHDPTSLPRTCFEITWSAGVDASRQILIPSATTQEATLTATPGRQFTIVASIKSGRGRVVGRTPVDVE